MDYVRKCCCKHGHHRMPSTQSPPTNTTLENSSFVSGGSRQTAPIKTAIIRPTNFYDGTRRLSFGSSPGSKLKPYTRIEQLTELSSPEMPPLTPGADSDPLSDNCAVMYGTNATRRRRSKVEAWIESSSSAHSEESLGENRPLTKRTTQKQAMKLSSPSSTLSREEVELSFEDLCQELLALSASCSTLERMISKTEGELEKGMSGRATVGSLDKRGRKDHSPADIKQTAAVNVSKCFSPLTFTTNEVSMPHDTALNGEAVVREDIDVPSRSGNNYRHQTTNFSPDRQVDKSEILHNSNTAQTRTVILPGKKMTALTIDVGCSKSTRSNYRTAASIPIRDSLVTITSSSYRSPDTAPDPPPRQYKNNVTRSISCGTTHTRHGLGIHRYLDDSLSEPMQQTTWSSAANGSKNVAVHNNDMSSEVTCGPTPVDSLSSDSTAPDHVAAAITTLQANDTSVRRPSLPPQFHRSMSEPSSFVTLTPSKRVGLAKTPSKRDGKGRQFLRVGMDFIRPKDSGERAPTAFPTRDNQIKNNLDDCNSPKSSMANSEKIVLPHSLNGGENTPSMQMQLSTSTEMPIDGTGVSDSWQSTGKSMTPVFSSTHKSRQFPTNGSTSSSTTQHTMTQGKVTHDSLSSSFESEALDIVASLKSAGALKAQIRHGKFPIDVDPITGSPRQPARSTSEEKLKLSDMLSHGRSHPSSTKSSCLNSPSASFTPQLSQQQTAALSNRSPLHSQTPFIKRCRQSCYDNVLQSPYTGLRISVASGSSSGTVFSRPWGDLPKWDDFQHNDDFRHRVGSAVSSQGRLSDAGGMSGSPIRRYNHAYSHFRFPEKESSRSPSCYSRSVSEEREQQNNLFSIPRFPVASLPDVALQADVSTPQHQRHKSNWESSLDRTLSKVRTITKLLHSTDGVSCEITRYTQQLLSDNHSLPGTLIGRFHTCTWETNSLDRNNLSNNHHNRRDSPKKSCLRKHNEPKTDWYSGNTGNAWPFDRTTAGSIPQAYSNGAYLLHTGSRQLSSGSCDTTSSTGVKEHIVLSNVRQFIDGMKRFLLNRPDTQMMFAIQRERIKLGSDEFINLDAIMEAVLERVILQPLSDHLLNIITTHSDYSIREITLIESGTKVIVNGCTDLFPNLQSAISEIDSYDHTLRSVFQSVKSEYSPISKLQYLMQIALLFVLICSRCGLNAEQDLLHVFIYALARYGDATLVVHLAYVRHLIPASIRSGTTAYFLGLYENAVQVYSRIAKVPGNLARSTMILNEILDKLNYHLMIADESTNKVIRKKISLSRWCSALEVMDIIQADLYTPDLNDFKLYLATDEKEVLLKETDNVSELLMVHTEGDKACALVYRRTNTQMLLPPP